MTAKATNAPAARLAVRGRSWGGDERLVVDCPRRGRIDLDRCAGCPDLVGLEAVRGAYFVLCKYRSPRLR